MSHKILIAVDTSENALKAVAYASGILPKDSRITLYHVFPKPIPDELQNEDSILQQHYVSFKERIEELKEWFVIERATIEKAMEKAKNVLIDGGTPPENIQLRIEEGKESVAKDILNEVQRGNYDTVIVGRRGLTGAKGFFTGSVSNKIVHHAKDCAVWVVE